MLYLIRASPVTSGMGEECFITNLFYIGKGIGNRCHDHVKAARSGGSGNLHKDRKIRKIIKDGHEVIVRILKSDLSSKEAMLLEIELISKIGRHDRKVGPLTNLTDGGEGVVGASKELRQKRRTNRLGKTMPDEVRSKISQSLKGHVKSEDTKQKLREAHLGKGPKTGWNHNEASKKKMSEKAKAVKRKPMSEETKQKIREALKGRTKSAEHVEKARVARLRNWKGHTDEVKTQMKNHKLAFYSTDAGASAKRKISASLTNRGV